MISGKIVKQSIKHDPELFEWKFSKSAEKYAGNPPKLWQKIHQLRLYKGGRPPCLTFLEAVAQSPDPKNNYM